MAGAFALPYHHVKMRNSKQAFLTCETVSGYLHNRVSPKADKTTLVKTFFAGHDYVSLEDTDERGLPTLYFWRDRVRSRVDVIIDAGKTLIPVEIKSGETVSASFLTG